MSTFSLLENYKVNSTFYNLTRIETGEARDYGTFMKSTFGIIATLSFFGNMLLCLVIFRKRSMLAKQYNILICSLAVTDMLTGRSQYMKHFHSFLFLKLCHKLNNALLDPRKERINFVEGSVYNKISYIKCK